MLGPRDAWLLDPAVTFLNHGSFGACPRPVLEAQQRLREEMERQPVEFLDRRLPGLLAEARAAVAAFLHADVDELVFVPNATTAVNTVVKGVGLVAGDEVVTTDHAYPAVQNLLERACAAAGASRIVASVGLPFPQDDEVCARILAAITPRARLVVVDHVASPTGAIFPVERIARECRARGVLCMIDGAHAPGMLDVDLRALTPDFWTGNFHKWVCAPKGAAVLHVAREHQPAVRPLVTSHAELRGFHAPFDWTGTHDPTPSLAIPAAIGFLGGLGWEGVRAHNDGLARHGREVVAASIGSPELVRDDAFASMAVVELPGGRGRAREDALALQARLYAEERIEVPFVAWGGRGLVRLSAHVYNRGEEYQRLAAALPALVR